MTFRDMLLELNDSCEQYGLKMNANKTKTMIIGRKNKEGPVLTQHRDECRKLRTDRLDTATCTHTLLSTDVHIKTDYVRYTLRYLHCFSVVSCPYPSDSALNGILIDIKMGFLCPRGLEVNPEKTKYMIMSRDQNIVRNGNIKIGHLSFEEVEEFKYLGATVTYISDTREEIKRRINMGNA
ncbi:hypothetical protein ANN_18300 [Periplaneta americana]|uniref:Reverse transcriptase domain-containing protein n=1 Tax=Periplaneta americana TaxID=6978 RepID=A0ABQ8SND7_PERAM|nr:hypothetical protein ANN_18300 [Periplaneta americana]